MTFIVEAMAGDPPQPCVRVRHRGKMGDDKPLIIHMVVLRSYVNTWHRMMIKDGFVLEAVVPIGLKRMTEFGELAYFVRPKVEMPELEPIPVYVVSAFSKNEVMR